MCLYFNRVFWAKMAPIYHTPPPPRSTKTYTPCKGVGVFVKNKKNIKININKSSSDLKVHRILIVSMNLILMSICKLSLKKSHMINSAFRGKPYVLCLKVWRLNR